MLVPLAAPASVRAAASTEALTETGRYSFSVETLLVTALFRALTSAFIQDW